MATKPVNNPPEWASSANYAGGPDVGKPTKYTIPGGVAAEGHRGGKNDPTAAQYFNDWLNKVSALVRWVFAGSSSGAADAHIVETNSVGSSTVQHVVALGAGQATQPGLTVFQPVNAHGIRVTGNAAANDPAVNITHPGAGTGLLVSTNNAQPAAGFSGNVGVSGSGLAGTPGVRGAGGPTAGAGVEGNGGAGGVGVTGVGGSGAAGVSGTGGAGAGGVGGEFVGTGNSAGASATGFFGVTGTATSSNGYGCYGTVPTDANPGAAGVFGQSLGASTGVSGQSDSGTAGDFYSTSGNAARFEAGGAKPTVVIETRGSDPTSHEDGSLWHRSNGLKTRRSGVTRRIADTAGGSAFASDWSGAGSVDNTLTTILSATLSGANAPAEVGRVVIRVALEVGRDSGTPDVRVFVYDDTAPLALVGNILSPPTKLSGGAGEFEKFIAYEIPYTLPAAGSRTFSVQLQSTVGGNDINYRYAGLTVSGVF